MRTLEMTFPLALPRESLKAILDFVRGATDVTKQEVILASWIVLGYGASIGVSYPQHLVGEVPFSKEKLAENLEGLLSAGNGEKYAIAVNWALIFSMVLQLLQSLLGEVNT